MRVAIRSLALAAAILAASYASAQTQNPANANKVSLPTYANPRMSMTSALGNIFGIRSLLPSFRSSGQGTGGVPGATMYGAPNLPQGASGGAEYLKGFGYQRLGK